MKHYRIHSLVPGLNGLVAEGEQLNNWNMLRVERLIDAHKNVGDRCVAQPVSERGLYIDLSFLEECEDPMKRQFASDSPFGRFLGIEEFSKGRLHATLNLYENACGVNLMERQEDASSQKTLFSQYFRVESLHDLTDLLSQIVDGDADDVLFKLQDMKEKEKGAV